MTKQSEAAKTLFIENDPDKEQKQHPTMVGWTEEFRTLLRKDAPVRYERLAAIGKNEAQIRLHKKG